MSAAYLSLKLELTGLFRLDVKQPNGITLVRRGSGRLLVWDATCPDTLATSPFGIATSEAGVVTVLAERSKHETYILIPRLMSHLHYLQQHLSPDFTVSIAWVQVMSSRLILVVSLMMDFRMSLHLKAWGEEAG